MNTTKNDTAIGVWPTLVYRDGQAALTFLTEGLGFTLVAAHPGAAEGSIAHAELTWPAGGGVMVSSIDRNAEPNEFDQLAGQRQAVYLVHSDPDTVYERVLAAGATLLREMREEDYGSRGFSVTDPEDNVWSIGTYAGER
ncbi:Glyoxalase/bleomycin resistance protein/dioxygenase [Kribbella flavida DSM 17836]|uniref:Glyoxalase/bleomycin resistance protein/dioxygenase n=1 Tax=Kribbella flavida (strain DSM 17836 / JCM 10339 / NBRC 14399) TaxID=479435 RepID=D2Q0I6_KRIFD|nr:VOC family protein [Kribbella flavida]ADB31978.1 Glyoxalase/bleomycin resistance protein/dioxygenase [Kribbella flavida DSM 17836]